MGRDFGSGIGAPGGMSRTRLAMRTVLSLPTVASEAKLRTRSKSRGLGTRR